MKKLLYVLLFFPLFAEAQALEDNPLQFAGKTSGKRAVEKCEEFVIDSEYSGKLNRKYFYNKNGKLVSDVIYNADNQSDSTYFIYTYNGLALETKKYPKYINMETDVVEAATEFYEYDSQMKLVKKTMVTIAGDTTKYTYAYNEAGQLQTILADSAERKRYTYFYNDTGKVVKILGETPIVNAPGWLLTDSFTYEYDAQNNLKKELHIKEKTERKRSVWEYNAQSKLSRKTVHVYGDTKPVYTIDYTFDNKTGLPAGRTVKTLPDKNKLEYKTVKYMYAYTYRK